MSDVRITIVVPAQTRTVFIPAEEWEQAVESGEVWDLLDPELSDFTPETEIYGPAGEVYI